MTDSKDADNSIASVASAYAEAAYGDDLYAPGYFPGVAPLVQLSVDPSSGVPTPIQSTTPQAGPDSQSIVVSPNGNFVYVQNYWAPVTISAFNRDSSTGALTEIPGSPFYVGPGALGNGFGLAIDPSGKFLYSLAAMQEVYIYAIDQTTGGLSLQSQPTEASLNGPNDIKIVALALP
jgi:DNA-binding beta-propeller fold protein YncE